MTFCLCVLLLGHNHLSLALFLLQKVDFYNHFLSFGQTQQAWFLSQKIRQQPSQKAMPCLPLSLIWWLSPVSASQWIHLSEAACFHGPRTHSRSHTMPPLIWQLQILAPGWTISSTVATQKYIYRLNVWTLDLDYW